MSLASRALVAGLSVVLAGLCAALAVFGISAAVAAFTVRPSAADLLRVCAKPDNLPYSNERGEGFEDAIVSLVAHDLNRRAQYTWTDRRGIIGALESGGCDLVAGVAASFDRTLNTDPYYASTWAIVTRRDRRLGIRSLDDPRLRMLSVDVFGGSETSLAAPPADEVAIRHLVATGRRDGRGSKLHAPLDAIAAVARTALDAGIAWGPIAGYFASLSEVPMEVTPLASRGDRGAWIEWIDVAMGVRRGDGDEALRTALNAILEHRRGEIESLLDRFNVLHVPTSSAIDPVETN